MPEPFRRSSEHSHHRKTSFNHLEHTPARRASDQSSTTKIKASSYPQKRYTDIATGLGVIGSFGGGFAFSTLFSLTCSDSLVKRLLEFAAVLFIGSLSMCIPVFCAVHGTDEEKGIKNDIIKDFVRCQLLIAGLLLLSALLCVFLSMYYFAFTGPFMLAMVITAFATISSIFGILLTDKNRPQEADNDLQKEGLVRDFENAWNIKRKNIGKTLRNNKRRVYFLCFGILPIVVMFLLGLVFALDPHIKTSSRSRCSSSPQNSCCISNQKCCDPTTSTICCDPTTSTTCCDPTTSTTCCDPTTSTTCCDPTTSTTTSTATSTICSPATLSGGNYEFPHLIVPIDSSLPSTTANTSFNGTISSTISSLFNFDIPLSDSGKTCSLVFLFPQRQNLETSSYSFSGDGKIDFTKLATPVTNSTTYSNVPPVAQDLGEITVSPGNSYVISVFSCPAGQTVAYEMKNAGSTNLTFLEDYNPSPLGLFIIVC